MSAADSGRPRTCGHISDSADATETLGQLLEFRDLARDGWVLDTSALFATMAFSREDVGVDARLYAEDIRPHLPIAAFQSVIDLVIEHPNSANVRSLANQCRAWLYTVAARSEDRKLLAVIRDATERADLYAAALGHAPSCERAAVHAYDHAGREKNPVLIARYSAVALGLLAQAQILTDGNRKIVPVTSEGWMLQAITRLQYISDAFDEHREAAKVLTGTQDDDPIVDLLSDLPDADEKKAPDVDAQADLDALLDAAAASHPAIDRQPLPAVVVLQSVNHLPESKSSTQPNPRLEYAPLAGVYMPLAETPDLHAAARTLTAEMPWAKNVIETILNDSAGSAASRVRNTLLIGRPGSGKTRLARRIGELLGMQPTIIPAAGVADSTFGGTSRSYSTGRASTALQTIRRTGIANAMLIIDEIEKAASGNYNGRLTDVLIPFLEPETSRQIHDPFVETAVDLSRIGWISTANSVIDIPGPLLDRFRTIEVPQPRRQDLPVVAKTILSEIRQERGEDEIWLPDLDSDELEILAKQWRGGSLRPLRRMIEVLLAGRMSLAPRH